MTGAKKQSAGIKYNGGSTVNEIITPLFNPKDLNDSNKFNFLIRQNFLGEATDDLSAFEEYKDLVNYIRTEDLLDFEGSVFDKSFTLSPKSDLAIDHIINPRELRSLSILFDSLPSEKISEIENDFEKAQSDLVQNFRLNNSKIFDISIGKRVTNKEIEDSTVGIPIFSANVFQEFGYINKELLDNFELPSVIWGIDGDWMVNYIEKHKPFYPTDHCGVMRVKSEDINPRYLTWALENLDRVCGFRGLIVLL